MARAALVAATDEDLVAAYRHDHDRDALRELILRHRSTFSAMSRKYFIKGSDREDVEQEALIGFTKAVRDYDLERAGDNFASFARGCIKRHLYTAIRNADRLKHRPLTDGARLDAPVGDDDSSAVTMGEALPAPKAHDPVQAMCDQEDLTAFGEMLGLRVSPDQLEMLVNNVEEHEVADLAAELISPDGKRGQALTANELEVLLHRLRGMAYVDIAEIMGRDTKFIDNCLQRFKRKVEKARQQVAAIAA